MVQPSSLRGSAQSLAQTWISKSWINVARLRRRRLRGGGSHPPPVAPSRHHDWIRDNAPGRSFADIGGLFGIAGDTALLAEEAGAAGVTLFDAGDAQLTEFPIKKQERSSNVRFVQGDVEDPAALEAVGPHDIVWCVGVIYHSPNPVRQLMLLREITRDVLYLGSHTIPEVPGVEQACVYFPYISEGSRDAYAAAHSTPGHMWGVGQPFVDRPMVGHGNFWWGITPSALRAMLRTARFEVVEERPVNEAPFFTEIVARPVDAAPVLPPTSYFREYGETVAKGGPPPPFETFYEDSDAKGYR